MQRFMFLAVLAAVTAAMFSMLADGGGKAEALPFTITAEATGVLIPPIDPGFPCFQQNGDFEITANTIANCGDGDNDYTEWEFDFNLDPGLPAFRLCGPVTSAVLILHLTPRDSLHTTDGVGMWNPNVGPYPVGLGAIPGTSSGAMNARIQSTTENPVRLLGEFNILTQDLFLPPVPIATSAGILNALDGIAPAGKISMGYQDDSIVSYARLDLTVNCQPGPGAVGGVVGLLGDANTPVDASGSSSAGADAAPIAAAVAAAVVAIAAGGWYVTRRWAR